MNPAALKVNIADLKANGILIVNSDSFKKTTCARRKLPSTRWKIIRSTSIGCFQWSWNG